MDCVSYNKLRFIILKLEIELVGAIIENIVNKIRYIRIKFEILSTKYKKLIYKKI